MPHQIAVITGAGAGIGRATARTLARAGCDVALVGRDAARLDDAAAELAALHIRTLAVVADVTDAEALERAADQVEDTLGPITLWVNCAGAGVSGQLVELSPEEIRRATDVTYLGTVFGTRTALIRMRRRGYGTIVNLDALSLPRPLRSIESGARAAIRAFTESLRPEILHDGDRILLSLVSLPAINTPRFVWTRNHTGKRLRPAGPVFEPEIAAEAISRAAFGRHRDVRVGLSGIGQRVAALLAPALLDRRQAVHAYRQQLEKYPAPDDAADNLFAPVPGAHGAHGPFDHLSRRRMPVLLTTTLRAILTGTALAAGIGAILAARRRPGA
ncbi:SDR family oxidoreductase [Gluconacetobacter takamatsuzukensis]|uniref:SDR family NAD(P)-dependent oxidoreductase n=1 Tax=Gluconacetobacter takamatsuzukensis TaxID=1286190 RepID=A0A7W4KFG8_9PROT|nr:SDR family oxidoreductase [Gluconacetobacter takamatsuzukensis]MBB2205992.1 SDR family NAD(P)-dependent oxidoreductase [Gluconacetobacter takamatsuzukensis]